MFIKSIKVGFKIMWKQKEIESTSAIINQPELSLSPIIFTPKAITPRHPDQQAILDVFLAEVEQQRQGQDLINHISMMLPPARIFRPSVLTNALLFSAIFRFMQQRGVPVNTTRKRASTRKSVFSSTETMY